MRTFVISDIHGDMRGLISVMTQFFDAGMNLDEDRLIFLGDYVDGYPESREVVEHIRFKEIAYGRDHVICLKGNHEDMLVRGYKMHNYHPEFQLWYFQGGRETAQSYAVHMNPSSGKLDLTPEFINDARWMQELRMRFEDDHYHYVHAGFRPHVPIEEQNPSDMLWIREDFIENDYDFGKMVVFGHTAISKPIVHPTKIQLDTRWRGRGYVSGAELFPDRLPQFYKSEPRH